MYVNSSSKNSAITSVLEILFFTDTEEANICLVLLLPRSNKFGDESKGYSIIT